MSKLPENWSDLTAPFTFDEIHWRVGPTTKDKTKTKPLAYMDARNVMDRLDTVLGPQGWSCDYSGHGNGVVCSIAIKIDGEWVSKADGAGETDIEGTKGAYSDAFKRAAVRWGIGRYLYGLDCPWVGLNPKYNKEIDPQEMPKLRRVYDNLVAGKKIPSGDVGADKAAKAEYNRLLLPLQQCQTRDDLSDWNDMFAEDLDNLPEDYRASLRGEYSRRLKEIKTREMATV